MIRYTVTATIQSNNIDAGEPVDVNWYTGTSLGKAISAMSGAAAHDEDVDHGDLPEALRYRTLSVRLDKEVLPDPDVLTYTVDFDDSRDDAALDDCAWYDNQYQPWARVDCYGRMAHVTMFRDGYADGCDPLRGPRQRLPDRGVRDDRPPALGDHQVGRDRGAVAGRYPRRVRRAGSHGLTTGLASL